MRGLGVLMWAVLAAFGARAYLRIPKPTPPVPAPTVTERPQEVRAERPSRAVQITPRDSKPFEANAVVEVDR